MKILITGGAGFVGSSLATAFKSEDPKTSITVLDNLRRRGSELNLERFKKMGIHFAHGDIRNPSDILDLDGNFDLLIEASAEPSVLAGLNGSPNYVLDTNLTGTLNCLEFARHRAKGLIFLSTSRVYSIKPLKEIGLREGPTRFEILENQKQTGITAKGVSESFPTHLARSLYGATKLASELIIQEYVDTYRLPAIMNRCGVLAGAGQFGKTDQGVFTHWVVQHYFSKPLKYTGFGGEGKQVRDLLHPLDLYALIKKQHEALESQKGAIFNVGGGIENSTSMFELTRHCQNIVGNLVPIHSVPETSPVDIPLYVSDNTLVRQTFDWQPTRSVENSVKEIALWIRQNEAQLKSLFV